MASVKEILASGKEANNQAVQLGTAGKTKEASSIYATSTAPAAQKAIQACDQLVKFYEQAVGASFESARRRITKLLRFSSQWDFSRSVSPLP